MKNILTGALLMLSVGFASADELKIKTFNPGTDSIFQVATSLIMGPTEALLVDAQFQKNDAEDVVKMVRDSGRKLTTIYISHGDPDYYFGLDVISAAFPKAKIVATPSTVAAIEKTIKAKVAFWGPILKDNAPAKTIIPTPFKGSSFNVDGEKVAIIGLNGHDPKHTFLWVPSAKTVVGGVLVYENLHVWVADAATVERRNDWRSSLDQILALNPAKIIPGHFVGDSPMDTSAVAFTKKYLNKVDAEVPNAANSSELVAKMLKAYPNFRNTDDLKLGAAVLMGERTWP